MYFFRYNHAYAACKVWILWVDPFFFKNKELPKNKISPKDRWRRRDVIKSAWMET